MRNIYVLWKNNLKTMVFKSIYKFLGLIMIPVIITVLASKIFAGGDNWSINIGVANEDNTIVSEYIVDFLGSIDGLNIIELESNDIKEKFSTNDISSAVIIDKEFEKDIINGDTGKIKVISKADDSTVEIIKSTIEPSIRNLSDLGKVAEGNKVVFYELFDKFKNSDLNIKLETLNLNNLDHDIATISFGFIFMIIMLRGLFGATKINNDKKECVYSRILVSGTSTFEYYFANMLGSLTALSIQNIMTLIALEVFTKIEFGVNNIEMFIILFLVSVLSVAIGTLCIAVTNGENTASMLGNIIIVPTLMISGTFVPLDMFNETLNKISSFIPTRWVVNIMISVQEGGKLGGELKNIALILIFSMTIILIVAFITKNKNKQINGI